jgi:hypothetical protein
MEEVTMQDPRRWRWLWSLAAALAFATGDVASGRADDCAGPLENGIAGVYEVVECQICLGRWVGAVYKLEIALKGEAVSLHRADTRASEVVRYESVAMIGTTIRALVLSGEKSPGQALISVDPIVGSLTGQVEYQGEFPAFNLRGERIAQTRGATAESRAECYKRQWQTALTASETATALIEELKQERVQLNAKLVAEQRQVAVLRARPPVQERDDQSARLREELDRARRDLAAERQRAGELQRRLGGDADRNEVLRQVIALTEKNLRLERTLADLRRDWERLKKINDGIEGVLTR